MLTYKKLTSNEKYTKVNVNGDIMETQWYWSKILFYYYFFNSLKNIQSN